MFVLLSSYTAPQSTVDAALPAHRDWLAELYAAGRILVSGRRSPATGGVIILRADSREEVTKLLQGDPYVRQDLVDYEIVAFDETPFPHRSPGFDAFMAEPPVGHAHGV